MDRLRLALVLAAVVPATTTAFEAGRGHDLAFGIEAGYVYVSGLSPWTDGSVGKLRFEDDGFVLNRAYVDYRGRLFDTLHARVALEAYDDDIGYALDYTQAYLEWRPVPRTPTRYRLKVGTFYPRISLENSGPGWSSPYTLNSSAINTWVAEELRSTGAELTISRRPASLGGAHTFSASVAAFVANDPAGALLAWKGWSVHDRQTRPGDNLPLPPLPTIQPGGVFDGRQEPWVQPFREIDGEVGYSVNMDWRVGERVLVRAMHFNNRGDPRALDQGQYGWYTEFDHVGIKASLPWDIGLLAQVLRGATAMGPDFFGWHVVDVEYDASYLMLTRAFGKHRIAVRYDEFDVSEIDDLPDDDNDDAGHAWTLNYQYALGDSVTLALEWLTIRTRHDAWVYYGLQATATEKQAQATLRMSF